MAYEARYLAWNCELKTRLSDIVSHLRNSCRQILTQQLHNSFSTMLTACKFSEIPLFIYLSLRLLQSLFKKFENKCKNKREVHVYDWPWPSIFANAMKVLTVDFEMAFWSARSGWNQTILLLFSFFLILFSYAIQGKFITWLVNSALNCTWKPISHSSLRDSCDIGFRVQCNAEFPRQVMNFLIEF